MWRHLRGKLRDCLVTILILCIKRPRLEVVISPRNVCIVFSFSLQKRQISFWLLRLSRLWENVQRFKVLIVFNFYMTTSYFNQVINVFSDKFFSEKYRYITSIYIGIVYKCANVTITYTCVWWLSKNRNFIILYKLRLLVGNWIHNNLLEWAILYSFREKILCMRTVFN